MLYVSKHHEVQERDLLHLLRPRQGKVDNRLLPGKTVKVSGKE
jgi:hypothetical protein